MKINNRNSGQKKLIVSLVIVFFITFLFGNSVFAQDEILVPRFNPICWEKKECEEARAEFVGESSAKVAGGWLENQWPCDQKGWGMCLPVNVTTAQVSFGGTDQFSNIGDYIKTVYNYALVMLSILAVVMIIIAGMQWMSSAGNSDMIGKSKKRITGAIIGLFIAFMSYNILQTINPATVNLRLPQIYMIRPQILPSKWCKDLPVKQLFAFAVGHEKQSDEIKSTGKEAYNRAYPHNNAASKEFWCGQRFFIEGSPATAYCWGDRCDAGQLCVDFQPPNKQNPHHCRKGSVAGKIIAGGDVSATPIIENDNDGQLFLVCSNGKAFTISNKPMTNMDKDKGELSYIFAPDIDREKIENLIQHGCAGEYKGFLLGFDFGVKNVPFNYEYHWIGATGKDVGLGEFESEDSAPAYLLSQHYITLEQILNGITVPNINGEDINICLSAGLFMSNIWQSLKNIWAFIPGTESEIIDTISKGADKQVNQVIKCLYTNYYDVVDENAKKFIDNILKNAGSI